jgi:hypothetical protein
MCGQHIFLFFLFFVFFVFFVFTLGQSEPTDLTSPKVNARTERINEIYEYITR